jgi:hypothetical protein
MATTHPLPPTDLASRTLPIKLFTKNPWWRVYPTAYDPIFFGKTGNNRYDAPADASGHRAYGVLYFARDPHGAFIETFGHTTGIRAIDRAQLSSRGLAKVTVDRPLRLVDLRGEGLARIGADEALCAGPDYTISQAWSASLHDHPKKPDGLIYRARHDPSRFSIALFERASAHVRATRVGKSFMDPKNASLLGDLLDTYDFGLI